MSDDTQDAAKPTPLPPKIPCTGRFALACRCEKAELIDDALEAYAKRRGQTLLLCAEDFNAPPAYPPP